MGAIRQGRQRQRLQLLQQRHQLLRCSVYHRLPLVGRGCGRVPHGARRVVVLHLPAQLGAFAVAQNGVVLRALRGGAAGYLTKGAALEEMVQAIRQVFAGQRYISPQIAQQLAIKSFQPTSDSPFDALSEREIQIALMIANCQKVQTISDKLCLSPKTVNTYRYRIYEKLSITSDVELALLAVRHGMVDAAG